MEIAFLISYDTNMASFKNMMALVYAESYELAVEKLKHKYKGTFEIISNRNDTIL